MDPVVTIGPVETVSEKGLEPKTILVVGTYDTKDEELRHIAEVIRHRAGGC